MYSYKHVDNKHGHNHYCEIAVQRGSVLKSVLPVFLAVTKRVRDMSTCKMVKPLKLFVHVMQAFNSQISVFYNGNKDFVDLAPLHSFQVFPKGQQRPILSV